MLAALLLAGIVAAPVSSAALFVPVRRPARTAGRWPATRRLLLALAGTVLLAAFASVCLLLASVGVYGVVALTCSHAFSVVFNGSKPD